METSASSLPMGASVALAAPRWDHETSAGCGRQRLFATLAAHRGYMAHLQTTNANMAVPEATQAQRFTGPSPPVHSTLIATPQATR